MITQTLLTLALTAAPMLGAAPATTDDLLGVWLSEDGTVAVEISRCEDSLCGKVVWLSSDAPATLPIGTEVLTGLSAGPDDKGEWTGGQVYDVAADKTYYKARLTFESQDRIELKGFAGVQHNGRLVTSRFDSRLHWTRSSREQLAGS